MERAADILFVLAKSADSLSVRELARKINTSSSTAYRILSSLKGKNLVVINESDEKYRIGYGLLQLGSAVRDSLRVVSLPHMKALRDLTRETVTLNVYVDGQRVVIQQFEGLDPVHWVTSVGDIYPLHAGASGQVLMAYLSEEEIERILTSRGLDPITPNTIISLEVLKSKLQQIRERGFVITHGEGSAGGSAIMAPVRDGTVKVVASVGILLPTFRLTEQNTVEFSRMVTKTASDISSALGYY